MAELLHTVLDTLLMMKADLSGCSNKEFACCLSSCKHGNRCYLDCRTLSMCEPAASCSQPGILRRLAFESTTCAESSSRTQGRVNTWSDVACTTLLSKS